MALRCHAGDQRCLLTADSDEKCLLDPGRQDLPGFCARSEYVPEIKGYFCKINCYPAATFV